MARFVHLFPRMKTSKTLAPARSASYARDLTAEVNATGARPGALLCAARAQVLYRDPLSYATMRLAQSVEYERALWRDVVALLSC